MARYLISLHRLVTAPLQKAVAEDGYGGSEIRPRVGYAIVLNVRVHSVCLEVH